MDAKELRIGNWIIDWQGRDAQAVIGDLKHSYKLEPIPLTEQWLKDFGFDKNFTKRGIMVYKENLSINNVGYGCRLIRYVHQLQNLYFALTGEELIKKSDNKENG